MVGDPARVLTAPAVLDRLSHDFYWYSPVLRPKLACKTADVAVQPLCVKEVLDVLRFAGRHEVPVTVRGAGTGNYGQCVPLEGGIVLDLSLMDKLEEITPDGVAIVPARVAARSAWKRRRASRDGNCACILRRW